MFITQSSLSGSLGAASLGATLPPAALSDDGAIIMTAADPLPVTSLTQAIIPDTVDLVIVAASPDRSPGPLWQVQNIGVGRAQIDLDADYRLTIDETLRTIGIENYRTGALTTIWGQNPDVLSPTGPEPMQFWGTTTFVLENATRITVNTKASADNPDIYMLDRIVITQNDKAAIVKGVGNGNADDMKIRINDDGWSVDLDTPDNFVVRENGVGDGWLRNDKQLTQAILNRTAPGQKFDGKNLLLSDNDLGKLLTRIMGITLNSFLSASTQNRLFDMISESNRDNSRDNAVRSAEMRLIIERAMHQKMSTATTDGLQSTG